MVNLERRRGSGVGLPTTNQVRETSSDASLEDDESPLNSSHDWGSPIRSHRDQGLHHRHVNRRSPNPSGSNRRETFPRGVKRRRKKYPCSRWLRSCILAGIPAYLLLIFLFLKRLNHQSALEQESFKASLSGEALVYFRSLHSNLHGSLAKRLINDNDQWELLSKAKRTTTSVFEQRRNRTQPPSQIVGQLSSFAYSAADESTRPETLYKPNEPLRNAMIRTSKVDEICGAFAQNLDNNGAFIYRDALRMPKTRVSRVLITGILNQVAFLLALALKERCNVQVVIGFDSMFPNSISTRLRLQEQMAILTKHIPKLVRPIFLSYIGIDPFKHPKNFKVLDATKEVDIIKTLTPTHIVHLGSYEPHSFSNPDPEWRNSHSPYPREGHIPSLYALQSGMLSMEQILSSIAAAPEKDRPHFIYAGSLTDSFDSPPVHSWGRMQDEVLADYYYRRHGIYSVGMRFPSGIYGPWGHPHSPLYRVFESVASYNGTSSDMGKVDLLHAEDVVDGIIGAMQYRLVTGKPVLFNFGGEPSTLEETRDKALADLTRKEAERNLPEAEHRNGDTLLEEIFGWAPKFSTEEGLLRTLAWHIDRMRPYGSPPNSSMPIKESGDTLLKKYSLSTCSPDDLVCHSGRPFLPCASECSIRDQCTPTIFDSLIPTVRDLTGECDIALYTQDFAADLENLALQSEYIEESRPQICNFAFVNAKAKLVDTSIAKVPDKELEKLGIEIQEGVNIDSQKRQKLNGRLLYRGWILVWADIPDELSAQEEFFLKLSPGKLFHSDVKSAVFIDQGFGVSPKADDILFLVHEMHRQRWQSRVVKRKTRPKAKILLPSEPERRAAILMSELKYQDSAAAERLSPDEKISVYEATRFMRFSNGEEPLGREPADIKLQREFYDRLRASINPDQGRRPDEPAHKFELKHWSRSRWVAHDLEHEEARQLRCEWYQEHSLWQTSLDQLSFAYIMEKLDIRRKLANKEPDDAVMKQMSEQTEMKKLFSDTFEWHALETEQNKQYSPYEEMRVMPYEMDYNEIQKETNAVEQGAVPLFVRVISDRIMAFARKSWNKGLKNAHVADSLGEL